MSASSTLRGALVIAAALLLSASAHAQSFRAYLSGKGSDANPCSLASPCRLLPAALAAVVDGGEIWMLDSANFNSTSVTIAKSVSILAVPGAVGSVLAIGGPAINITAAGLNVALRNVVIAPLPSSGATDGVSMTGASTLTIEQSLVANLPGRGVFASGAGKVRIANTILRNNSNYAVWLQSGPQGEISGSQMLGNALGGVIAYGAVASTTTTATVSDSVISGGSYGVLAYTEVAGATAKAFVTRSTIEGTAYALACKTNNTGTAILATSANTVVNNYYGWYSDGTGALIRTLGNNHITDNLNPTGPIPATPLE